MKKYTIKNYKGNIVESLTKFQKKHPNVKICEATEEEDALKVKCEEKETVEENLNDIKFNNLEEFNDCTIHVGYTIDKGSKTQKAYAEKFNIKKDQRSVSIQDILKKFCSVVANEKANTITIENIQIVPESFEEI